MDFLTNKRVTFNEDSINRQKMCMPGPNVVFGKNDLPFYAYLSNMNIEGALGCGPGKYPKYTDGKYCCVDSPVSQQEQLDYVNFLLENAMKNVNETVFEKYIDHIHLLIQIRNNLLKNKSLTDNLMIPDEYMNTDYTSDSSDEDQVSTKDWLDEWFNMMILKSNSISSDRPDPIGGKTTRRKGNKKSRRNKKRNKKRSKSRRRRRSRSRII